MPITIHLALLTYPRTVIWAYVIFFAILAIGLATIFLRKEWQSARGLDKVLLFGPLFYAAPVAAFGTEHFTLADIMLAPQLDFMAQTPEWDTLTAAHGNLRAWLQR